MDHRYGRHGPHAWKKRRKRLFERKALVPFVHTGVIVAYVPAIYLERITIVVAANVSSLEENLKELPFDTFQRIKDDMIRQAQNHANNRAKDDKVSYSLERIRDIAVALAKQQIATLIRREKISVLELHKPELEEFYADYYVDYFIREWTVELGYEIFPEEELAIKEDALQDKQLYRESILPNLTYLATLRAISCTKVSKDDMVVYLANIAKLVDLYIKTYLPQQDRTQQGGGQAGPATFPN